jgi:hypothetical protein
MTANVQVLLCSFGQLKNVKLEQRLNSSTKADVTTSSHTNAKHYVGSSAVYDEVKDVLTRRFGNTMLCVRALL